MTPRLLPCALLLAAAACTPLLPTPAPVAPLHEHALRPDTLPAARPPAAAAPVLALAEVRAGPLLDGRRMLYRDRAGRVAAFAENRWTAPPEAQLAPWLVAALERAGGVAAVVAPGGHGVATLLLDAELLALQLDSEPVPGSVQLELRLQLVAARSRAVVATTRLRESETLAAAGPDAMAAAAGQALTRLLDASATFVRQAVAALPPPGERP